MDYLWRGVMEYIEYEVMAAVERHHWWYGGMRAITIALLDPHYAQRHDLRILDAGCGTGGNALFLQRYGRVVGVDLAQAALERSPPRLSGRFTRSSVLTLPFADASFDLVTSFDVLYHRRVQDELVALREVRRVLRPEGRLLLRLPAYEFLRSNHDAAVHTRRRYTTTAVRELVARAGLLVEHCSYVNSFLFPVALATRLTEKLMLFRERQHLRTSSMNPPSALINITLRWALASEASWLKQGTTFPFGLSIICLARCGNCISV